MSEAGDVRDFIIPQRTVVDFAALCENVLVEGMGTLSLIRVVNRIFPADFESPRVEKLLELAINLIEGTEDHGLHTLRVKLWYPNGHALDGDEEEFEFPEGLFTSTHQFSIWFATDQPGLHAFDIFVDDELRKRVFLQAIIPASMDHDQLGSLAQTLLSQEPPHRPTVAGDSSSGSASE